MRVEGFIVQAVEVMRAGCRMSRVQEKKEENCWRESGSSRQKSSFVARTLENFLAVLRIDAPTAFSYRGCRCLSVAS
jgi:hypothetical protein